MAGGELRFETLSATARADAIGRILRREIGGFVLSGALERQRAARFVERLEAAKAKLPCNYWNGEAVHLSVFGPMLEMAETADGYFEAAARWRQRCAAIDSDGLDPVATSDALLASLSALPFGRARDATGRELAPGTLRHLPNTGFIGRHFDLSLGINPRVRAILDDERIDWSRVLSFFLMLQEPDEGGELAIYGSSWHDFDPSRLQSRYAGDDGIDVTDLACTQMQFETGDLVVFDAGENLHAILPVGAGRGRWTFGGFLARSADHRELVSFI